MAGLIFVGCLYFILVYWFSPPPAPGSQCDGLCDGGLLGEESDSLEPAL